MSRTARALRATSDTLLRDLETLAELEVEKRQLPPEDPRLVALASNIAQIASRVLGASRTQHELTIQAQTLVAAGHPDAPVTPIESTPRDMAVILAEWRDAERRAASAIPGSVDAQEASSLVERLRAEYRDAQGRPEQRGSTDS